MENKIKIIKRLIAALGILFLLIFTTTAMMIYRYSQQNFMPTHADYALILGARTKRDNPSPAFKERIEHGIELFQQGYVQKLVFTGKPGKPPQAIVAKQVALQQGVPESNILVETKSKHTLGNLYFTKEVPNWANSTFLIVTSPLHLKRAMLMAQDLGFKAYPSPTLPMKGRVTLGQAKFLFRETFAYLKYQMVRLFK